MKKESAIRLMTKRKHLYDAATERLREQYRYMAIVRYGQLVRTADEWFWLRRKEMPVQWMTGGLPEWRDHCECRIHPDGYRFYISQPYGLSVPGCQELFEFCKTQGLVASITGQSWHYPGWTIAIVMQTKEQFEGARSVA